MLDKHAEEVELARRLFDALNYKDFTLTASDRPDVVAEIGGRCVGVEITVFHADEKPNRKGSALRAAEEEIARKAGGASYAAWGIVDPLPGLHTRIGEKISVATAYDAKKFDELWLLIVGQFPKPGAVVSTYPPSICPDDLNRHFNRMLSKSPFGRVYLHLLLDQTLYAWSASEKWRLLSRSLPASGGSTLWFQNKASFMSMFLDFLRDLLCAWKAFLAGSFPVVMIAIAALLKPEILPLPIWIWVLLVVVGLCCGMFQVYRNLRIHLGTNMLPMPDLSGEDAIKYVLGTNELFGNGAQHIDHVFDLFIELAQQAAYSNITIWGKTNTTWLSEQVGVVSNLQEIPAAYWNDHTIDGAELAHGRLKTTIASHHSGNNDVYSNLKFNKAQVKYFKRSWQKNST